MEGLVRDLQAIYRAVDDVPYSSVDLEFARTQYALWCKALAKEITRAKPYLFWEPRGSYFSLSRVPRHKNDIRLMHIDRAESVAQEFFLPYFELWNASGERRERMFALDLIDTMSKLFPENERQQPALEEIPQKVLDMLGGNLPIPGLSERERSTLYTIAAKKITGWKFSNHHTEKTPHQNK
jgi:hypothetical protein